jgi:hypothetical protein
MQTFKHNFNGLVHTVSPNTNVTVPTPTEVPVIPKEAMAWNLHPPFTINEDEFVVGQNVTLERWASDGRNGELDRRVLHVLKINKKSVKTFDTKHNAFVTLQLK